MPINRDTHGELVIHTVHGTWPYGYSHQPELEKNVHSFSLGDDEILPWFLEGSAFERAVIGESNAIWKPFKWKGTNSFRTRAEAAHDFHEHLKESFAEFPQGKHVIVAHSHGGTVAVSTCTKLSDKERERIEGIVTMAAPFITLKSNISSSSIPQYVFSRLALFLIPLCVVVISIAFCLDFSQPIINGFFVSAILWIALTFLTFLHADRLVPHHIFSTTEALDIFDSFDGTKQFKNPLVALRAPGDEASLVIIAAQALRSMSALTLDILSWPFRIQESGSRQGLSMIMKIFLLLLLACLAFLTWRMISTWSINTMDTASQAITIFIAILLANFELCIWILMLGIPILAILLSLAALAVLMGVWALRVATGPELWKLSPFAEVECEPVPAGMAAIVETLRIGKQERLALSRDGALRHSLHEFTATRDRVAALISDWFFRKNNPVQYLSEGGGVRDLCFDLWEEKYGSILSAGGALAKAQSLRDRSRVVPRSDSACVFTKR